MVVASSVKTPASARVVVKTRVRATPLAATTGLRKRPEMEVPPPEPLRRKPGGVTVATAWTVTVEGGLVVEVVVVVRVVCWGMGLPEG